MAETKNNPNPNLAIWQKVKACPTEAQKPITAGRLKGKTDINPVWRLRMLTELYGPCGIGWYVEQKERWTETYGQEVACFVRVHLFVRNGDQWSAPIEGIGGNKLATAESSGIHFSDEAYKMAYTDAISVACKSLGMAADVYFAAGARYETKYEAPAEPAPAPKKTTTKATPAPAPAPEPHPIPEGTDYKPLPANVYDSLVKGEAYGELTKTGISCKRWYIQHSHAGAAEIAAFDKAVAEYRTKNNINA